MPKWAKIVLRTVGVVNSAALLLSASFLVDKVYHVLTGRFTRLIDAPYFEYAFWTMTLIEASFLGVFLATSISFVRARLSAVNLYSFGVLLYIPYFSAIGMLWRVGRGVGASIGAASSTSGTAVFEFLFLAPFLYPIVSMVVVQLLKRLYGVPQTPVNA